ncbi:major facilitator superfamily MFS_1 [Halorubrum californiense DSM 19288]|uniref:Major facilitator superfamily MFS_1 n=1 Tax=Halorubrum californiense DSM 19288 TaxID=1227465 RepID=M0E276_9EURY|nr:MULTISPECIES: MFS transporter [Halorubrum]ELZ41900.1 major facilitator superfamily MFS_1 [Halorubrum californiense DSM 19288]TKX65411.1 MFS transporter [Halorubrum sp. GN11GM_10-3_MGM]
MAGSTGGGFRASLSGPILKYYAYKATKAVEFYRPIMYLFFLAQGLSFTQIAVLEALYNLTTLFGEIPTGYVGDRVGRRNSLLVGTALISVTLLGIGLSSSFLPLAGLYVCWSLGYNFRSGSEDAWLYDTLTDDLSEDEFASVRGRGESAALAVGAVAAVSGGYLGSVDLSYPWFVAAGVTSLGVPVLLTLDEPETYEETASEDLSLRRTVRIVRDVLSRRRLRSLLLYYYVLYAAVTYLVFVFLQPIFETVVLDLGVPKPQVESLLGWFYAAYSLVGAVLTYYTGAIRERIGLRTWFLVLPFAVGGALVGMYFVPVLAVPTFLLIRGVSDVTRSFAGQYVNDRVESLGRATVLSAMAMVSGLAVVPFQLGSGVVSDAVSPLFALGVAGVVLVVGAAAILVWEAPVGDDSVGDQV